MTRLYGDPVDDVADVQRRDDVPVQFWWRERRYLVGGVLGHWLESGRWWSSDPAEGVAGEAGPLDDKEREIWRVEVMFGQLGGTGVFDLCFDWSQGSWKVTRVQD